MIKKPISYYLNKSKNKKEKSIPKNNKEKEENKVDNKNDNFNNNNLDLIVLEKIDKKLSKLSYEEQVIYLKEKINEIKSNNGNKSKLLFDVISKLIVIQQREGDLAYNKGNYILSLEKYKECLQLNEPLPGSEWSKYSEWFNQRISIFNSIAIIYNKLNKKEQAIEYIKLSSNLEQKYNLKVDYKSKYNDIFFLTGKQLILQGNYKDALKYLLKVEKNKSEEYSIDKILNRKKIDERFDKNFIEENPDEYIYLLNLIYQCCIKQKDYDLGETYYHKYEEIYKILSKVKKIKYPFKGINDISDDELDINSKIKDINDYKLSDFHQRINDNFLVSNNEMIDKAENRYDKLSPKNEEENNIIIIENNMDKEDEKEEEEENIISKTINTKKNMDYKKNYNVISWGGKKIENKKTVKTIPNEHSPKHSPVKINKIPVKNKNEIKKINLAKIKLRVTTNNIRNLNQSNQKLNNSLNAITKNKPVLDQKIDNSIIKITKKNTISEEKVNPNKFNINLLKPEVKKEGNKYNTKPKNENLKQTIKEGNYYPPYDFVFKKPEKYNTSTKMPKILMKFNENKDNINMNVKEDKNTKNKIKTKDSSLKNFSFPKINQRIPTESNENKKGKINYNNRFSLKHLKNRSSSNNIENINRFVRIEEKLKSIEKNLLQKNKRKSIEKKDNKNKNLNINYKYSIQKPSIKPSLSKDIEDKISQILKNMNGNKKNLLPLPPLDKNKSKSKKKGKKDDIKKIKKLQFPSQQKRKFSASFFNSSQNSSQNENDNEDYKSIGSFISFGNKENIGNENKEKKRKKKEKDSKNKRKGKEKEKVELKYISEFKPKKFEINKNNNKKDKKLNKIEAEKEKQLRFKSFPELIAKYFKKSKLIIYLETKEEINKYEKMYKRYEFNHMILNKMIDNRIYTITFYLPILHLSEKDDDTKLSSYLETQITYRRNDSKFFSKYKIILPIKEEYDFFNEELKEKIIEVLLNKKTNVKFAWIIFLYYFENYFNTHKIDLENRAKQIVNTDDKMIDENKNGKNPFDKSSKDNSFINIQKDYIYYFVKIINKQLYNITQWKNKKILVGNKKSEMNIFCNMYYNLLHKYMNIYSDFLYLEDTLIYKKVQIRNLEIESIKNRNKIILDSIQNILNYSYDFKQLSQRLLLKKLIYNSFINTDIINVSIKQISENNNNIIMEEKKDNENIYDKTENQNLPLLDTINIIRKFKNVDVEQYFYDNQIIYKGIIKMKKYDYMHLTISIRQFEKIILNAAEFKLVDNNIIDLKSKNHNINFDILNFLSTDKDIVKLYSKINIDFSKKFYDTTKYKTFLQLTLVNLNPNSKWYDITYIPWEMYNYFISLFQEETNKNYFLANPYSMEEIARSQMLNGQLGALFYYFISNFCDIENGALMIKNYLYKKDLYWIYFMNLYNLFDDYIYGLMYSQKYINKKEIKISFDIKLFYQNFLAKIHYYYYKIYFKENKYYIPERIDRNKEEDNLDSDEDMNISKKNKNKTTKIKKGKGKNAKDRKDKKLLYIVSKGYKDNYKSVFEKEDGNLTMTFNLYLKLGKNRYNTIFKIMKNRIHITNDPDNIKNYLLPTDYLPKIFVQIRSILSNELVHTNIYNIDLINNIKYMFDNNSNDKLLKTYFENLIHIVDLPYGKKIIFDFLFNSFSLKSKKKNIFKGNDLSILNIISIILQHETNYNSSILPENIILVKTYKTIFINIKKQLKILFNFRIYGNGQKIQDHLEPQINNKKDEKNKNEKISIYHQVFGKLKKSKLAEKIEKKYPEIENNNKEGFKIVYYYYFISVYYPKTSVKSIFILSTYDLKFIFKKIKNKNIRAEYLTTPDNLIEILPKKFSLQNTRVGRKLYINFSKYKELRTDWEKQLPLKNTKNKMLFEKKLSSIIDKKSELKIFLKPNFINLRSKESLYDISTDEMILTIQKIKIFEINDKKLSSIVTIYYHRILEYWSIFLFFPFSARKFTTIIEPKHMENIITSDTLSQINRKEIRDKEIFEFIINESRIVYNFEEIAYLELLNMKLLLKEILYYGYELISDGVQTGLNKIIYIEITIKSLNLFTLDKIEKVLEKIEIDQCYIIFQSFSFHELYWHKENFKLQDLEPYYSNKIIIEKNINIKKNNNTYNAYNTYDSNSYSPNKADNGGKGNRKLLPYYYLRKLIIHVIQPYVNSQQHIFEKQMKLFTNKNIIGGNLQKLIDSTKYDKANQLKIANLYQQKLNNKIIFNKIYTETIRHDPPVIASVGINLLKEKIFITLYYPFKSKSYDIEIDFETVKQSFFPYFLDILTIDKANLGKRILRRYQNFITKTPHFHKFFQESK